MTAGNRRSADDMVLALAASFAALSAFSKHSLSPTQSRWARRAAGHCLWALGIESYADIHAVAPDPLGETIDATPESSHDLEAKP